MKMQFPANISTVITPSQPEADPANYKQFYVAEDPAAKSIKDRVMEGFVLSHGWADRLADAEHAQRTREKLARSSVRGSFIQGITTKEHVEALLEEVSNWRQVETEKNSNVIVVQGDLPERCIGHSFAAYGTIRQLNAIYGPPGLSTVQIKAGHQREDEFYLCTTLKMPTSIITVQLRNDSGEGPDFEFVHQWFAGPELSSLVHEDDGDTVVRCGVIIPYATADSARHGYPQKKSNGYTRDRRHAA